MNILYLKIKTDMSGFNALTSGEYNLSRVAKYKLTKEPKRTKWEASRNRMAKIIVKA